MAGFGQRQAMKVGLFAGQEGPEKSHFLNITCLVVINLIIEYGLKTVSSHFHFFGVLGQK